MQHKTRRKLSPRENKTTQEGTSRNPFLTPIWCPWTSSVPALGLSLNHASGVRGLLISELRKQLAIQIKPIIYSFS